MSRPTLFNAQNKGYKNGYSLLLGEPLGLMDTINVQHPILLDLYEEQLSQQWGPEEISLDKDRLQMGTLPRSITEPMIKTIMWQYATDSLFSRSLLQVFGDHITDPALHKLMIIWTLFESIHGDTYSHIVKQVFNEPNQMLEDIYGDVMVLQRNNETLKLYELVYNLQADDQWEYKASTILKALVATLGTECISFMGSFAVTFKIARGDIFQGVNQDVKLICRDEVLHIRFSQVILKILLQDPKWRGLMAECKQDCESILWHIIEQENQWGDYLLSEGRQVDGLTCDILRQYNLYMGGLAFDTLGIKRHASLPDKNPLPFMESHINTKKIQTAAQELELTNYNMNILADDTVGMDLNIHI